MTGPFFVATKSIRIWLAVLSSNYWFYDFDATSFHNIFKIFWIFFFVILVTFQFLSQFSNIDNSQCFKEDFFDHR